MLVKEKIIARYLHNRWYKKALVISLSEPEYLDKIHSLNLVFCTGYLDEARFKGCRFDLSAWPFENSFFDLIIIDHIFLKDKEDINILLKQLHFCMADDGDVIITGTENIRAYNLVSKFLAHGFLSKNLHLISKSNNIVMNLVKRLLSKNFVAVFKKDVFFKFDGLEVKELLEKKFICEKSYSRANIKQVKTRL